MKKLFFIVNLVAGRASIGSMLGEIINEFNKSEFEVTVHITQSGEDAQKKRHMPVKTAMLCLCAQEETERSVNVCMELWKASIKSRSVICRPVLQMTLHVLSVYQNPLWML